MARSLDSYVLEPSGKREYLQNYGYHFSKKAYQFATSLMKKKGADGKETDIKAYTQDEVDELLKKHNIKVSNNKGYDAAYVASMIRADYWGSSIEDELHLARHVKDVLDDVDASDDAVFSCWYAKMIKNGIPIIWEELM